VVEAELPALRAAAARMRQANNVKLDGKKKKVQKEELQKSKSETQIRRQDSQAKRAEARKDRSDYRDLVQAEVNMTSTRAKSMRVTK
jgi:hypothetical protein